MKRARNIVCKQASGEGIMGSVLLVILTVILSIGLVGLVSTPALAGGKGKHWHPRACSKTASAAYIACYNEKKDDYWIAQGNCYNSDSEDQAECFKDAKKGYNEAKGECQDQLDARKDLCDELGEAPYDPLSDESLSFIMSPYRIKGNKYFPLESGLWTYQTTGKNDEGDYEVKEINTVQITGDTVVIEGVTCVVVHDVVYEGDTIDRDKKIEDTYDWYAQEKNMDDEGNLIPGPWNVWYFGERSLAQEGCDEVEAEDCVYLLTNEGSWKTGFDEAQPGILMKADPQVGDIYRQEFALGDAEDAAKVISTDYVFAAEETDDPESLDYLVPGALATELCEDPPHCVVTLEFTPLEPDVRERKYYAPGKGVFLEVNLDPENPEWTELISGP